MEKKLKKSFLKAIALVAKKSAEIGCNSASIYGYHQPIEPKNLKEKLKNIK